MKYVVQYYVTYAYMCVQRSRWMANTVAYPYHHILTKYNINNNNNNNKHKQQITDLCYKLCRVIKCADYSLSGIDKYKQVLTIL